MIRVMTIEDYDGVYALWKKIRGFGLRSIDDSGAAEKSEDDDCFRDQYRGGRSTRCHFERNFKQQ